MSKKSIAKKEEGNAYYKKKEFDKAKKCYLEGIQADPTNIECYSNLAMVQYNTDKFNETIDICNKILSIDSENKKAFYRKSQSYHKLNNNIEAIKNGKIYLQKQNQQKTPNLEGLQTIKIVIKECKQKIASQADRVEVPELGYIKPYSLITQLPEHIKQIQTKLIKQDPKSTLKQYKDYLKIIFDQLNKNYKSQVHNQIDKIKKSIYKRLIDLQNDNRNKISIIDILLNTSNSKEDKEKLLVKKLKVQGLSQEDKISTMKTLYEITKKDKLGDSIKQEQNALKQIYNQQLLKQQKEQQSQEDQKGELNGTNKGDEQMIQSKVIPPLKKQQEKQKFSQSSFIQKVKHSEKHKNMEQFFGLFKLISKQNIEAQQKIECLKILAKSSILNLYSKGAVKGQNSFIKKLCKELDCEELYDEFNFK